MTKIVVLGGGTAGWLTALLVKEFYPQFDITVVESDAIGILGAGEGTVPHIVAVLDFLKIPVSALVRECSATLKTGIKFTNWHGDGTAYFHTFTGNDELEMWSLDNIFRFNVLPTLLIGKKVPLDSASFIARLAGQGKVPFVPGNIPAEDRHNYPDPLNTLHHLGSFALHFDARLLAKYLGRLAQSERNITRVEGKLAQVQSDAEGNITITGSKVIGEWAVTTGTNTYNFTVPSDGTYVMWVKGNIPNGIIIWNATLSISNSNVPAIGTQYAWNYTGGGSPILLTTIPDQIRGAAGTISTDATYAGTTSNRFDFGISNTSGSSQTIYYGYAKIS